MDLDAYFERIGYHGSREPTLAVLHAITRAHTTAIPFENLDVLLGRAIDLRPESLFDKLVRGRRGGYCFEQNGLLLSVLEQLGFSVVPISARVRIDRPRDVTPPRTHVFLRVELEGESSRGASPSRLEGESSRGASPSRLESESYLTDVGVGALSLTGALRLHHEGPQSTPHEPRRIVREGARLFHQVGYGDAWHDVCEFTLEEMPFIDRVLGNWYTSAHPESHFKNRLIVARADDDGARITLSNDELKIRDRDGRARVTPIASHDHLLEVLAERFGLRVGDADFRAAGWPFR